MSFVFVFIVLSAILDIIANLLLNLSDGFKRINYGVSAIVLVWLAFYLLSLAITEIPLAIAYTLWGAIGIVGTTLGGWYFFKQKLNFIGWIGIGFVIIAIVILENTH
ncbi:ligand-binding protein SH3 [Helicobacter monodelphidis]|uniref:SMR family transporter n=1 Tax=Helicobacter sp. 15-1451 TaxID=2004995 RepID=UPI000DCCD854|nr:SMR family transporter [Helicobacter sp. 15-1451]RAX56827.1 ligand-binding protein SH3 [Helicobacter sp. 15-1451]